MSTFSTNTYPYFYANQVLTHTDLNNIVRYLDANSRTNLVLNFGMGIVQGLEIKEVAADLSSITITQGMGISSDGYIFRLEADYVADKCQMVKISSNAFKCVSEELRFNNEDQKDFIEIKASADVPIGESAQYKNLRDCLTSFITPAPNQTLEDAVKEQVAVVFLWYQEDVPRKFCFDNCNNVGADRQTSIKILLARKSELKTWIKDTFIQQSEGDNPPEGLDNLPYLSRLGFKANKLDIASIITLSHLKENYKEIDTNAVPIITREYQKAYGSYGGFLGLEAANPFNTLNTSLQDTVNSFDTNTLGGIQYLFDYFKDLIWAYEEFEEAAALLAFNPSQILNRCSHPGFISLGLLSKSSDCRTEFYPSNANEDSWAGKDEAYFYLKRMVELVKAFKSDEILKMDPKPAIKITPSRSRSLPLSEHAIPYYYDVNKLRPFWNFKLSKPKSKPRHIRIPSYHEAAGAMPPYKEHLLYDTERYDFYRIEGLLGHNLAETITKVKELRATYNLAFDIQCVILDRAADEKPREDNQNGAFEYNDLQLLYIKVREDIRCQLNEIDKNLNVEAVRKAFTNNLNTFNYNSFEIAVNDRRFGNTLDKIKCNLSILQTLYAAYQERKTAAETETIPTFSTYAKQHPGLEHLGGVPKGGTFVIAYVKRIDNAKVEQSVVAADFCLPYLCCGGADAVVATPEPFILILKREFCCSEEQESQEVFVYPKGGKLEAKFKVKQQDTIESLEATNGIFKFDPCNEKIRKADNGDVQLVYTFGGKEVATAVTVGSLADELTIFKSKEALYDRSCNLTGYQFTFANTSGIRDKITWKVTGKVEIKTDKIELFSFTADLGTTGTVTLVIEKAGCRADYVAEYSACPKEAITLTLPAGQASTFDLKELPEGDKVALNTNVKGGRFTVVKTLADGTAGGNLSADFIEQVRDEADCAGTAYNFNFKDKTGKPIAIGNYLITYYFPFCKLSAQLPLTITGDSVAPPEPGDADGQPPANLNVLLTRRSNTYTQALRDMTTADRSFGQLNTFKLVDLFRQMAPTSPQLDADFTKAAGDLNTAYKRGNAKRKAQLTQLAGLLLSSYLDKQFAKSTETVPDQTPESLQTALTEFTDANMDIASIKTAWKTNPLKTFVKSEIIQQYEKLLA